MFYGDVDVEEGEMEGSVGRVQKRAWDPPEQDLEAV